MPKTISFQRSSILYNVGPEAPWEVYLEDRAEWIQAFDLVAGDRVHGPYGTLTVDRVIDEVDEAPEDTIRTRSPLRPIVIGDMIANAYSILRVQEIVGGFVSFECGTRLPYVALAAYAHHPEFAEIEIPSPPARAVAAYRATHKATDPLVVYHLDNPGWYEIPGYGPVDCTTFDPDTYISVSDEDIIGHMGTNFRARYDLEPVILTSEENPEVQVSTWHERLLG